MNRRFVLLTALLPFLSLGGGASAETLFNDQGLTAPCIGIGPVMNYCEHAVARQNFVPAREAGVSGVTVGRAGESDGVITAVASGSAAAQAGLVPGDVIISVDDRMVRPNASRQVARQIFGAQGRTIHLTVKRDGKTLDRAVVLAAAPPPPGAPKSPNFLIGVHPVVNWEGRFIPCMGAGALGPVAVATCVGGFRRHGYIPLSDLGTTGLSLQSPDPRRAVVSAVEPGSPAATSDVRVGDELTVVDGQAPSGGIGDEATERLFGPPGAIRRLSVSHSGQLRTVSLPLEPRR